MQDKQLSHHAAWLAAHPGRSAEWLAERLADGFHVHHLDGDHGNDDPANLVLIEAADHMRLHGMPGFIRSVSKGPRPSTLRLGSEAYGKRLAGSSWRVIGRNGMASAKAYAIHTGIPWPPATRSRRH